MINYLKNNIRGFTNKRGYSFDFSRDDLKNYNSDACIIDNVNDAERLVLFNEVKTIVLPKKVTLDWIDKKLNADSIYRNFVNQFSSLVDFGGVYAATYGIGYSCSFRTKEKFDADVKNISEKLNSLGIEFYTQFSDAAYVLRFVISTKKENTLKIM